MKKQCLVDCELTLSQRYDLCLLFPICACVLLRTETSCCLKNVTSCCQGMDNICSYHGKKSLSDTSHWLLSQIRRETSVQLDLLSKPNMAKPPGAHWEIWKMLLIYFNSYWVHGQWSHFDHLASGGEIYWAFRGSFSPGSLWTGAYTTLLSLHRGKRIPTHLFLQMLFTEQYRTQPNWGVVKRCKWPGILQAGQICRPVKGGAYPRGPQALFS